ncbi:MAG TPA: phosphotransferase [Caulobacteraceae bacterium]|jgi:Ser/Thr protein kinase RdoA (MazF antagonist)
MRLAPAYSTISASSIAAVVDQNYEIAPVVGCRLFHTGFNDTYELEGANGRSYMARLSNRRFRGPANVAYETALLIHLHRAGVLVGVPLADREGRLWTTHDAPEGPRELAVFERLAGRGALVAGVRRAGKADDQTLADVAALGASLARIHLAGETFDGPPSLYRLEAPLMLDGPLDQLASAFGGALAEEVGATAARLRGRLDACAPSLSVGHCHGDNHAGNTVFADAADGTVLAGWFDFDDGGPGFLAYDLATFLWSLLLRSAAGDVTDEVPPLWRVFIRAYRSVRATPVADVDAVGLLVAVRHFWLMGNFASRLSHTPIPADWFRQALGLVRKWEDLVAPLVEV